MSISLEPFFVLKEIQSLDRMIQNHQKLINEQVNRLTKISELRKDKQIELTEAEAELKQYQTQYKKEEASNLLITRDLTQTKNSQMAATTEQALKAANSQIAHQTPLKESSDQKLFELLSSIEEKEEEIKTLKGFLQGSIKTQSDITDEVSKIKATEEQQISDLEMRINLLTDSLPEHFKTKFASVNKKLRFKSPVTIIKNDHCGECFMVVSKMQISQVDRGNLETCAQCSRIFLPSGAS